MVDAILSEAVFVYYGQHLRSGSFPADVIGVWGDEEGSELIRRVRLLQDELFSDPPNWKVEDLVQATNRVKRAMREHHPELTENAIDVMGSYFAFEWK